MLTKKDAIRKVKSFVKACEEQNIIFKKVIVFGSVVSDKADKYSDIDVAFVSDSFNGMPFRDWSMLTPVKISNPDFVDIEPHTFATNYFKKGDPFIEEIKKTGIVVN